MKVLLPINDINVIHTRVGGYDDVRDKLKTELGDIPYGRNIRNYYGCKLWRFLAAECDQILQSKNHQR